MVLVGKIRIELSVVQRFCSTVLKEIRNSANLFSKSLIIVSFTAKFFGYRNIANFRELQYLMT